MNAVFSALEFPHCVVPAGIGPRWSQRWAMKLPTTQLHLLPDVSSAAAKEPLLKPAQHLSHLLPATWLPQRPRAGARGQHQEPLCRTPTHRSQTGPYQQ